MNKEVITIGLFGTCRSTKWRDKFIQTYTASEIPYFNPQVSDWKPEYAKVEAEHLANDNIILFPITSETYGTGSLSEVGFSILNAIKIDDRRYFVVLIDDNLDESLMDDVARRESLRSRALVREHLKKLNLSNVYMVSTLDEMLKVSLSLYASECAKNDIQQFSLKNN